MTALRITLAGLLGIAACARPQPHPPRPPATPTGPSSSLDLSAAYGPGPTWDPRAELAGELIVDDSLGQVGAIQGSVTATTTEPIADITVVATSPNLINAQVAITNVQGAFAIANLPPGDYLITMYYGDATSQHATTVVAGVRTQVAITQWQLEPPAP